MTKSQSSSLVKASNGYSVFVCFWGKDLSLLFFLCVNFSLLGKYFFFFPFKIWIRIAVVYNASPKSRHQRMWLAAMNPLAVHTQHSWLLGRKKNRSKAIMSCHCNNPTLLCSASQSKEGRFARGDNPIIPTESSEPPKGIFPFCYSRTALRKRKLQALAAPQSLSTTSDWNTSCNLLFYSQQHHFP